MLLDITILFTGDIEKEAFTDIETGTMVNSEFLNGLSVEEAKKLSLMSLKGKTSNLVEPIRTKIADILSLRVLINM